MYQRRKMMSKFKEEIYEIAFGDNAINRNFTEDEVVERIKEFSDKAWNFDLYFELEQEEDCE
jgi:hypothetical protein